MVKYDQWSYLAMVGVLELDDKLENMGAQMVKEVASKTSDMAGDGTITATLLATMPKPTLMKI